MKKLSNKYSKIFIITLSILLYSEAMYGILSYYFHYSANPQDAFYWKPFLVILTVAIVVYSLLYPLLLKIYSFSIKYLITYNSVLGMLLIVSIILSNKIDVVLTFSLSNCLPWLLISLAFISFILKKIYLFSSEYLIKYNLILVLLLMISMILSKIKLNIDLFLPPFDFLLLFLVMQLFISLFYKYKNPLGKHSSPRGDKL